MNRELSKCHRPAPFRPRVEDLEDRLVPTVAVQQGVHSNLIVITATSRQDQVRIVDHGGNGAGAIRVGGTGMGGTFESAAAPPGEKLALEITAPHAATQVKFFAEGSASTGKRDVAVNLGPLSGHSQEVRGRTIATREGELVEVVVSRVRPAAPFAFTVFNAVPGPLILTSGFPMVPFITPVVVPLFARPFPVVPVFVGQGFTNFFFNPELPNEFGGFGTFPNPFLNPSCPNEFAGFPG